MLGRLRSNARPASETGDASVRREEIEMPVSTFEADLNDADKSVTNGVRAVSG